MEIEHPFLQGFYRSVCPLRLTLETLILATLQALETLPEDPAYELHQLNKKRPGFIQEAARDQATAIEAEVESLEKEAAQLKVEITELTGGAAPEI